MLGRTERWWRRQLTGLLEPLRVRFERRRTRYQGLRRSLNQARFPTTYDEYLTRIAVTAVSGFLFATVAVFAELWVLVVDSDTRPVVVLAAVGVALAAGVVTGVAAWYIGYTRPGRVASQRARKLDVMLPSTVSYMYALAHGGMDAVEVVRRTADREDTYGEQAREMQMILNQMEYLGTDFVTALHNTADLTPCRATSDFLGDMVSVLESGGDFEGFLEQRRQEHVDDLTGEQEAYLEQLGLFAELYVSVLVAGPLFVIILLLVIGILGSSTITQVNALVYLGLPLGTALTILILDQLNSPLGQTAATGMAESGTPVPDDPDARAYADAKRRAERIRRLKRPLAVFVRSPLTSLAVTVPLAALAVGAVVLVGPVEPTVAAFRTQPLVATGLLVVVPFLLVSVPLAGLSELRRRVVDEVRRRFPDVLSSIARANRSGISVREAIDMEAERSTGIVGEELERLHNDIRWFDDPSEAFLRLADRARLPLTTRTMRLLAEANRASGNLYRTLAVAADEARFQRRFAESRAREVATYVAVAVISFLVFLGILLLIQQFYLEQVVAAGASASTSIGPGTPGSLEGIDAAGYRLAFLHSALVQGVSIGLVTGKLARGDALSGLKYSIMMVLVTMVAFWVV